MSNKRRNKKTGSPHMKLFNDRTIVVGNDFYRIRLKWSFVHKISEEYSDPKQKGPYYINPKFIRGIGMFRCRQTGDLRELSYLDHIKQPDITRI